MILEQAMSTANAGLAEAYMMRKLHKEKMKKMEAGNKLKSAEEKADSYNHEGKKSWSATASEGGCFSLLKFKKIHPNSTVPASADS